MKEILITGRGSINALGNNPDQIWKNYLTQAKTVSNCCFDDKNTPTGKLQEESETALQNIRKENHHYRRLDKSVLLAILAGRKAVAQSNWENKQNIGINIGSSRGATQLFEKYHRHFLNQNNRLSPLASPTTTLGNISSWLSYDLGCNGITISHSITCSTALHSIVNACAWINSGMSDYFLAGGSEAPITDFTVAQMRALGIYSKEEDNWKCKPFSSCHRNTMILGEGATIFGLEKTSSKKSLAKIIGIGYATEKIEHHASMSSDAKSLFKSMSMALSSAQIKTVDTVIAHAPGTVLGDKAELNAIEKLFPDKTPHIFSTKHQTGHTLGASGAISMDLAIDMISQNRVIGFPYEAPYQNLNTIPRTIMINAIGFGGNAVSIILQKTD